MANSRSLTHREQERIPKKEIRDQVKVAKLLKQLSDNISGSIPWASRDWANTNC
jgi:hypothetical protein